MKTPKQKSGGARLIEKKLKPILLGVTQADHKRLMRAAKAELRPLTQFLLYHGLAAADIALSK